ncbi:MAG: hypothetical protein AB4060_08300 [Crocosphaera sp.]
MTLNNISGIPGVNWNGTGNAEGSPNPGLNFNAAVPTLSDTFTVTLDFSQTITADWLQTVNQLGGFENQGASSWSLVWTYANSSPSISDPDDQLQDESTGIGTADFRISTNPGVGSTAAGGTVSNSQASWSVEGVASSQVQLTWSAVATTSTNQEFITILGDSVEVAEVTSVPEPASIIGLLSIGAALP